MQPHCNPVAPSVVEDKDVLLRGRRRASADYTSQPALRFGQRPALARELLRISNLQLPSLARGRAALAVAIVTVLLVLVLVVAAETAAAILVRPRKRRRRRQFAGATVSFFPPTVRTSVV